MRKTALITGASSGIGLEFSKIIAKNGYNCVLVARNKNKLLEIAHDMENRFGIKVYVISEDLSVPYSAEKIYQETKKLNLNIEMLINNAAFGYLGEFEEMTSSGIFGMIHLNIISLTELCHLFLKEMKRGKRGFVLNVASTASFQSLPYYSVYAATKAYVLSFTEAIAREYEDYGIKITCLCPGPTKTNFLEHLGVKEIKNYRKEVSAESVAKNGYESLIKGKKLVVTGLENKILVFLTRFMPRSLITKFNKKRFS